MTTWNGTRVTISRDESGRVARALHSCGKSLVFAIVGGIAAGMRCDASEWVKDSFQTNSRGAAYTVKTYTEGADTFVTIAVSM